MSSERKPVWFIFGNHKHWTGMVWEWGEDTLANSLNCMRAMLDETGLVGGLNFDGKGIEELAVRFPAEANWLRDAVESGQVELWGGTYTQPYGSLIGPESNVKQRQLGIAAFENLLGKHPSIFSEEEFDFFPQLPQILNQLGYSGALLFYQHTWHTPTFPKCDDDAIFWKGIDGSKLKAVPFSDRCLMRGIPTALKALKLDSIANSERPLMITWLEMLDKPNWMWQPKFVAPYMRTLLEQEDCEIRPTSIRAYLDECAHEDLQEIEYAAEDCYHGICVGKSGDRLPQLWRRGERAILEAELLASICSYQGQPYPQFDSYPAWKLNEAWRMLCLSQGHDAYECEGLTHSAGMRYAQSALMLARDVIEACEPLVESVAATTIQLSHGSDELDCSLTAGETQFLLLRGMLVSMKHRGCELLSDSGLAIEGYKFTKSSPIVERVGSIIQVSEFEGELGSLNIKWEIDPHHEAIRGQLNFDFNELPACGIEGAIKLAVKFSDKVTRWRVDSPFAVCDVRPNGQWLLRQPTGHWLTSAQMDQSVERPLCHHDFIAAEFGGQGVQYVSSQNSLALAQDDGFDAIVFVNDAWDQGRTAKSATINFALAPCRDMTNLELLKQAESILTRTKSLRKSKLVECFGNALVTGIRKIGEELEVRLFETEGQPATVELRFPWPVERVQRVDLLGNAAGSCSATGTSLSIELKAREIVTLRILFVGKRTEYMDLEPYRSIWVGDQPV